MLDTIERICGECGRLRVLRTVNSGSEKLIRDSTWSSVFNCCEGCLCALCGDSVAAGDTELCAACHAFCKYCFNINLSPLFLACQECGRTEGNHAS